MFWEAILAFVFGLLIPQLFLTFLPNSMIQSFGQAWGRKMSKFFRGKVGADNWESIENNFTGGLVTLANAIQTGADSDDAEEPSV